jgi:glycosyltransferase involved in cell wall biosynthesis
MHVTVAICTWNRAPLLRLTLAEMRKLVLPPGVQWEILVVNNCCTDDTDAVLRQFSDDLPVRRLYESRPGKSYAANTAVENAAGDLILWTDDDVLVDPRWLEAYARTAQEHPEADFFGGAVLPWFETPPPKWVLRHMKHLAACFATRETGPDPEVRAPYLPYGANMAIRRRCFDGLAFDVRIGPKQHSEVRGEETKLLGQLVRQGSRGRWVGEAPVRHFIPAERLTTRFIRNFFRGHGRTQVLLSEVEPGPRLFGAPRWAVRRYVEYGALSALLSPIKNHTWLDRFTKAAVCRGIIEQSRLQCRQNAEALAQADAAMPGAVR